MTKESDGIQIHSQARWIEHIREQFGWPIATVGLPIIPASEPMQMENKPPSEIDVKMNISFLKKERAPGPDGLFPSSSRDKGEVLRLLSLLEKPA